jgi:SOS response regulatory protein OraA/RecX
MLREKGISDEIALQAIEKELEGFDEVDAVRKMARKKYKTVKHLPPAAAKNRVVNFLRSRGYRWDTIKKAIEGMFSDDNPPEYS